MFKRFGLLLIICFAVLPAALAVMPCMVSAAGQGDGNLLLNSSFEQSDQTGIPAGWSTSVWKGEPGVTDFKSAQGEAHTGQNSAEIVNLQANDARFTQVVPVDANRAYRISGWIKTEQVGTGHKGASLSIDGKWESSQDIRGTSGGWKQVELYAFANPGATSMKVTVGIGGYGDLNTGTAFFDDIRVEEVTSIPAGAVVAQLGTPPRRRRCRPPRHPATITGRTDGCTC